MRYHAANRFQTRLAASVDESQIYFDVESASGCPEVPFKLTVGTEIVDVIGAVGNTFTVQRGAEGTTPQSHPQGALVQNRWTAGTYEDLWDGVDNLRDNVDDLRDNVEAHEANTTDAHGIDDHFDATAEDDVHGLLSGGFIIEDFGSNDDGSWVRWSNGLQVCWHTAAYGAAELRAGEYTKTWTLPMNFVDKFYLYSVNLTIAPTDATKGSVTGQRVHNRSASSADYYLSITTNFGSAASVELFAIGWWK